MAADPSASPTVTVRQLLLHTGGFEGDLFEDTGRGDDALDRYLVYLRGNARQLSPPGAMFSYSNSGYAVLGALVAKLRGGTWESVVRKRLVEPLGARHMALLAEEAILFRAAAGHIRSEVARPWQGPRSMAAAGTTPCAAPRDLIRFGRLFLDGGVAGSGDGPPGSPERPARARPGPVRRPLRISVGRLRRGRHRRRVPGDRHPAGSRRGAG